MKPFYLTILLIFFFTTAVNAQQEEYTGFLNQALEAAKKYDEENFNLNLRYFLTAMEKDSVTPEMLSKENFELYSACIGEGYNREFQFTEDIDSQLLSFLNYKIEEYPDHMYYLGCYYMYSMLDVVKASYWLLKAVEKGNVAAMGEIGVLYYSELFGNKDLELAKEWFEKAAALGDPNGMYNLGQMYENGEGVEQDYVKAKHWYEKAKDNGKLHALIPLAWMYFDGLGGNVNKKEAKQLCQKAISINPIYGEHCQSILFN